MGSDLEARIRNVTAVLGPTNTGKTHLAIERMLSHESGMIGLPLRLLAREVYDKIANRVGAEKVALITGEEKIRPERARYWVATAEAMPRDIEVDFLAVDEIQLCADPERGHVFTDRLLHARGRRETLLLGAQTMREAINELIPGANFVSRPRLSKLTYAGEKKITRLPTRSAIVAFSANDVYSIAELIRRQRGGAAVVLGALSPRTRNAQVALYQSGDVDFLVATDAVGMGLNLDVDHVAFSAIRKFDGQNHRTLTPAELGQIAGRAGRHMNDGTFGVTGGVPPLEPDLVERLESHNFESVKVLQWRNRKLDFASVDALRDSLRVMPGEQRLVRARTSDDVEVLEIVSRDAELMAMARGNTAVSRLWDVCQIPDYRKISINSHAEMIATLYKYLTGPEGRIPEDWFARQVAFADRTDGDIDTLANRIAHIRTWTFVSNRADWLKDPVHWQQRTRQIEDQLSDALHECLTQRFVDRRTSALMKGMRDKEELAAEIREDGAITVENHFVGRLKGFQFWPDTTAEDVHGKATRHAAAQVLSRELAMRARRVAAAKTDAFKLSRNARILWRDEEIARLEPADDPLKPQVVLLVDEHLSNPDREKVQQRLDQWIVEIVGERLKPLVDLATAEDLTGLARGIAFRLREGFGILKRESVAEEVRTLDQPARASLRKYGVRFGAFNIFVPQLLKPAAAELSLVLWSLKNAGAHGLSMDALPPTPRPGLTSLPADPAIPEPYYRAYGFHVCGPRAVRIDILERLADLIRPLLAWRRHTPGDKAPAGATGDGGFTIVPDMMSILGCSTDELGAVLKALGFWVERKKVERSVAEALPAVAPEETAATAGEPQAAAPEPQPVGDVDTVSDGLHPADTSTPAEAIEIVEAAIMQDAPQGETAVAAAATEATPAADAEPEMIDIWRPRRHRSQQGEPRDRRRGRRGSGGRHEGGPREQRVEARTTGSAAPATQSAAADTSPGEAREGAPAGEPAASKEHHGRRHERDRERAERREGGGRETRDREAGGRHGRDRERDRDRDPRQGHKRDDRSKGRRDEQRAPQVTSSAPRKKAGVDPDSPFAALSALKEAMAKQAKEKAP